MLTSNAEILRLQAENARLIELLEENNIEWRISSKSSARPQSIQTDDTATNLSPHEKITLFRKPFRGRIDVFPLRWESKTSLKAGYSPACANEWREGVCEKPRIKCSECSKRLLKPLTDAVIYQHLTGDCTVGVYPLLEDDTCYFLAVDFDEAQWQEDARGFITECEVLGVPVALEISRSGKGAHVWVFFAQKVSARDARRLGSALISHTCARSRQLALTSYDRLFPNQDSLPKGGFGNLIALPLQKHPRKEGHSVFVDLNLHPYQDQWAFLAAIQLMAPHDIEPTILRATGNSHPLDVTFIDEEDLATPWKSTIAKPKKLPGLMPKILKVTISNLIYFEKEQLPQVLANRLIRLAAFQNPSFYKEQAMRRSVWNIPRVIGKAQNFPKHIALPRGCYEAVQGLLSDNGISIDQFDERCLGTAIDVNFVGTLRPDQEKAVNAMQSSETGVLCAPTAFGKTVTAAAMIAKRGVSTLILVHRTELLRQWQERLSVFLKTETSSIGTIGGGKAKATGKIDIAVMQSLVKKGEVDGLVEQYGQVIVDECHHIGAASFDAILSHVKAKYVLGLTATPVRRDGQQAAIFMQCGPIRHKAEKSALASQDLEVMPQFYMAQKELPSDAGIQDVFRSLAQDQTRTQAIALIVSQAYMQGRKVLVLTERTEHLEAIRLAISKLVTTAPFVLHGRMSKKQRVALMTDLNALSFDAPRILLSIGKLVGEGFDHPPLDTLVLAMPVSWKGTLQQYAGRLHREHIRKTSVQIYDFVDKGQPVLQRMWDKRQTGYRAMGYRVRTLDTSNASELFNFD